jgi:hypothetical protein
MVTEYTKIWLRPYDKAYSSIRKIQTEARRNPNKKLDEFFPFSNDCFEQHQKVGLESNIFNSWENEGRGRNLIGKVEGNWLYAPSCGKRSKD